jgi:hypothetical protein
MGPLPLVVTLVSRHPDRLFHMQRVTCPQSQPILISEPRRGLEVFPRDRRTRQRPGSQVGKHTDGTRPLFNAQMLHAQLDRERRTELSNDPIADRKLCRILPGEPGLNPPGRRFAGESRDQQRCIEIPGQ